jgi:hypothetical protein
VVHSAPGIRRRRSRLLTSAMAWRDQCERPLKNEHALDQHVTDSNAHWMCWTCDRDFTTQQALRQHEMNSSVHYWCDEGGSDCGVFDSRDEYVEHCEDVHWFCSECSKVSKSFGLQEDLHYHSAALLERVTLELSPWN